MLRDPLPLTEGKSANALFAAALDFHKTARQLGHVGISISHYSFDRLAFKALSKRFKQYHQHLEPEFAPLDHGKGSESIVVDGVGGVITVRPSRCS